MIASDQVELHQLMRINCPEFYEDPDFLDWINGKTGCELLTWHVAGDEAGDYSDVFLNYDHGDGAYSEDVPEHIWEEICRLAEEAGFEYGMIWLTNLNY